MTIEVDDYARLLLHQSLTLLANELEELAHSLSGESRRAVEALCWEARQAISILNGISQHRVELKK